MKRTSLFVSGFLIALNICSPANARFEHSYKDLSKPVGKVGLEILAELPQNENFVFSPYNFFKLTAMIGSLLAEDQKQAVFEKLHLSGIVVPGGTGAEVGSQLVSMGRAFTRAEGAREDFGELRAGCWMLLNDSVYGQPLRTATDQFGARIRWFTASDPLPAVNALNKEVETFTDNMIVDFAGNPAPGTQINFYSVFYFKELWAKPFKRNEAKQHFTGPSGVRDVIMMTREPDLTQYSRMEGWTAVKIPCKDPSIYLLIVMPDSVDQQLDSDTFDQLCEGLAYKDEVKLTMPLFRIDYNLPDPTRYFKLFGLPDDLDFKDTDISCQSWGAVHQSRMDVDEEGMTGANLVKIFSKCGPPETTKVDIDRSFYFMVMRHGGAILNLGHVAYPDQPEALLKKR